MARNARGFTLLELMITVAVLAVALGVGGPSIDALLEHTRTTRTLHLATAAMSTARMEAVRRNRPVSVCPSADGRSCRTDLVWSSGWLVFVDAGRTGQPTSREDVLQAFDGVGGNLAFRATPGRPLVRFAPSGWSAGSNATLRLCSSRGRELARVVVNNAGRARTERHRSPPACPF
ncbi:MAG: GspH/FimT family pseudopilin [Pseudomonadota bacterium]